MKNALDQLPDNVDALKALIADQSVKLESFVTRNEQLSSRITTLEEQLRLAIGIRFASSSEKISPD